jgi:hypothetical protein
MGYRCPVCDEPQLDGEHLANHLAFTAMIRSEEHATWLDDRVDDWRDLRPAELAEQVTSLAPEEDLPEETEAADTHDHGPARERGRGAYSERGREAREMTREMHERAEGSGSGSANDEGAGGDATTDPEGDDPSDGNA